MSQVRRLLKCDDCGFQFVLWADKRDPLPTECPNDACITGNPEVDDERALREGEARIAKMLEEGKAPAIGGTPIARAGKEAEKMMTEMGMSNMADSGRQGEAAAMAPSAPHAREIQEMTHAMVEAKQMSEQEASTFAEGAKTFWQGDNDKQPDRLKKHINVAPAAAAVARREGVDPISLMHEAGKSGALRRKPQIVASVRG